MIFLNLTIIIIDVAMIYDFMQIIFNRIRIPSFNYLSEPFNWLYFVSLTVLISHWLTSLGFLVFIYYQNLATGCTW